MDPSVEKYSSPSQGSDKNATGPSQPASPSLQRAAQAHYVDSNAMSTPFTPPPPIGGGDDAPTLHARPSQPWPGQACRYCGWHPAEPGSTCPQCHQPVPALAERAIPWRPIAVGTSALTVVLVVALLFMLLHHPQTASFQAKTQPTVGTSAAPATTTIGSATNIPGIGATNTPPSSSGTGGGSGPGTAVPAPTHTSGTPLPTTIAAPTNTPTPNCAWQSRTSSGTYYIYWPGGDGYGAGHYGYVISATIHDDGCGRAYAGADVTSNDVGSPPSVVTAVLYRTANCNGSDKVLSQQHSAALVAGAHSVGTVSTASLGQHCVYAAAIDSNSAGNSQTVTSTIIIAD